MQVTETSADGLKREFTIVVPAGDLEDQISRRLGEIGQAIRLPGFRPGKVPMQLLRKRYGPSVRGEVLESMVQGSSAEAMREQNLRPALPPKVEIVSFDEGADLEYKMSVELLPDMPEANFADLGIERLITEVPDEDVDKAVQRLADQQRKTAPVERPAASGDVVVVDLSGQIDGKDIPGAAGQDREIEIGSEAFIPGFEDQLIGAVAGEDRTLNIIFPEPYANPDLAGKAAMFAVKIKAVKELQPAVVDDALAQEVGLENLAELRQEIRQRMQRDFDEMSRQRLKGALLDKLAERYDFPVPPGMLDIEFDAIWKQYEDAKQQQTAAVAAQASAGDGEAPAEAVSGDGASAEPATAAPVSETAVSETAVPEASTESEASAEDEAKTREEYRRIAERRVRLGLLLAEVGRGNNITVTQDELNQALTREARRHPGYERQVLDFYRKNPDAVNNLRAPIFEDKVVDFIVELAKVDERKVTPQELMAYPVPDAETAAAEPATAG